ncbi:hypothetical protein ISTM_403 [Insectomime virus]|uniref:Uncharacterized protein n=1 Tax=Tunisvirus fontaine2 TaxID=1421067 RepID=V9SFM2_9VIRU|nr:hypothetical protein D1R32_gp399 [Tunisvirus fontaine2]AHA46301.1 hypothetical protein ISTM_403 [Insectomime virus]AHC55116.1 hypothetical protein TNS_ORF398 [Tunisvirus fontaine2]
MSRLLETVLFFLEPFSLSISKEIFFGGNCVTVCLNIGNSNLSFFWVEATCGDEWWYSFPGENGTDNPQILLDSIQKKLGDCEGFERVGVTD